MERSNEDSWMAERMATLEPEWTANAARGRERLEAGLRPRRGVWGWPVAATAASALCLALISLPGTRALAQQLWFRFAVSRVDVVRLDLSKLPLDTKVSTNGIQQTAADADDVERIAGFRPYLPAAGVLSGNPQVLVTGPIGVVQVIHVAAIEAALRQAGANDVTVPAEWEGVALRAQIGPIVGMNYTEEVQILQARPIELFIPAGFSLERFLNVAFRSTGESWRESQALAQRLAANPAWLLDIPADEVVNVQEVALRSGRGLLIEDFDDRGALERTTVFASGSDRIYAVSAPNREVSLRVANALP